MTCLGTVALFSPNDHIDNHYSPNGRFINWESLAAALDLSISFHLNFVSSFKIHSSWFLFLIMTDFSIFHDWTNNWELCCPNVSAASWSEINTYIHLVSRREQRSSCPCSLMSSRNCSRLSDKLWCNRNITQNSWIQCLEIRDDTIWVIQNTQLRLD